MPSGAERREWRMNAWPHLRAGRAVAVAAMQDAVRRNTRAALEMVGPNPLLVPVLKCWKWAAEAEPREVGFLLRQAEIYEFERAGPWWGQVKNGVVMSDSGMLSAMSRRWIRLASQDQAILRVSKTYRCLRKLSALILEPCRPYLREYNWRARKEWVRLVKKAQRLDAELREANEARERAAAAILEDGIRPPSP